MMAPASEKSTALRQKVEFDISYPTEGHVRMGNVNALAPQQGQDRAGETGKRNSLLEKNDEWTIYCWGRCGE
jgi:hypothetical protein